MILLPQSTITPILSLFSLFCGLCVDLLRDSVKLRVLTKLTQRLTRKGHRVLVFSQSKLMVDIMQRMFAEYGLATCRIDGSVTGRDRQAIIDNFNLNARGNDSSDDDDNDNDGGGKGRGLGSTLSPSILLLTTKACGTGRHQSIVYFTHLMSHRLGSQSKQSYLRLVSSLLFVFLLALATHDQGSRLRVPTASSSMTPVGTPQRTDRLSIAPSE